MIDLFSRYEPHVRNGYVEFLRGLKERLRVAGGDPRAIDWEEESARALDSVKRPLVAAYRNASATIFGRYAKKAIKYDFGQGIEAYQEELSTRIDQTVDTIRQSLIDELLNVDTEDLDPEELDDLFEFFEDYNADVIGTTETSRAVNRAISDDIETIPGMDSEEFEWVTAGDERVRDSHVTYGDSGSHPYGFNYAELIGANYTLEYPTDPRADLSDTINCRCVLLPAVVAKAISGMLVKKGGPGSGEHDGHDFRGNQYTDVGGSIKSDKVQVSVTDENGSDSIPSIGRSLGMGSLNRDHLISLGCATGDETHVDVNFDGETLILDVNGPGLVAYRVIRRDNGKLILDNDRLEISDTGKGLGARLFAKQVEAAIKLGISRIDTTAAKGSSYNGYYTWARLGYTNSKTLTITSDGAIPSHLGKFVNSWGNVVIPPGGIAKVMSTKEGREWWKRNGVEFFAKFDLGPKSKSLKILREYMKQREGSLKTKGGPGSGDKPGHEFHGNQHSRVSGMVAANDNESVKVIDKIKDGGSATIDRSELKDLLVAMYRTGDESSYDLARLSLAGAKQQPFSGENMGIARADMPQIPLAHKADFLRWIPAETNLVDVDPMDLKPIQKEINGNLVGRIIADSAKLRKSTPILVSADGYVIDGHHRWAAAIATGEKMQVYKIDMPASVILDKAKEFMNLKDIQFVAFDKTKGWDLFSGSVTKSIVLSDEIFTKGGPGSGEKEGHDFRGNQYTDRSGGGDSDREPTSRIKPANDNDPDVAMLRPEDGQRMTTDFPGHQEDLDRLETPAQRQAYFSALREFQKDPSGMVDRYIERFRDPDTGTITISGDDAKEMFSAYAGNRSAFAGAVHPVASTVAKLAYAKALTMPVQPGHTKTVFFTAGGTGAGKSAGLKNSKELQDIKAKSHIIFDGTLSKASSAVKSIDIALKEGFKSVVVMTYRDPMDAWENGVITRAIKEQRMIPIHAFVDSHVKVAHAILELQRKYEQEVKDGKVHFGILDNSHGWGKARLVDKMPEKALTASAKELEAMAKKSLDAAHERGDISDDIYEGAGIKLPAERRGKGRKKGYGVSGLGSKGVGSENGSGVSKLPERSGRSIIYLKGGPGSGDKLNHQFHGNQYVDDDGGGSAERGGIQEARPLGRSEVRDAMERERELSRQSSSTEHKFSTIKPSDALPSHIKDRERLSGPTIAVLRNANGEIIGSVHDAKLGYSAFYKMRGSHGYATERQARNWIMRESKKSGKSILNPFLMEDGRCL